MRFTMNKVLVGAVTALMVLSAACGSEEPSSQARPKADTIAVVLDREISVKEADKLEGLILGTLRDRFAKDNKIEPTEAELNTFIAKFNELSESAPEIPELDEIPEEELRASGRQAAVSFVTTWKFNKALYDKYGGRVIFQQFGPEPVDAYRDFLREQERKGAFEILDKKYEASFWDYFTNDGSHSFYPEGEGARIMSTPWWLMETPAR